MVAALLAGQQGWKVLLLEADRELGGGVRTRELTLPGFQHDVCSAIHPFGRASPVLRDLNLEAEGLRWIDAPVPLAHPMDGEAAVVLHRDLQRTIEQLDSSSRYGSLMAGVLDAWPKLDDQLLGPATRLPKLSLMSPLTRFGLCSLPPASVMGRLLGRRGAALWAGLAGHSLLPMEALASSAIACILGGLGHSHGWPFPEGGAHRIAKALESKLRKLPAVEIQTETKVLSYQQLPDHRAVIFDLSARPLLRLLGPLLPARLRRALSNYRLGPGVFKVDYALSGPVPWRDPQVSLAGTVHLGGTMEEVACAERAVWRGTVAEHPFLLGAQTSLFDASRAPVGQHTFWVYAHVPNGWKADLTSAIEGQIERFAPGFRDLVLQRSVLSPDQFQAYNSNYVGGDILGGANSLWQVLARPTLSTDPYYLGGRAFCCSASVPPGGGIHGMGGFHAFKSAQSRFFG